jgi:alkaline phosphatase D
VGDARRLPRRPARARPGRAGGGGVHRAPRPPALPPGETIFYRARFESLAHPGTWSAPLAGCFRTPPPADAARPPTRGVRVAWSGDMVGQGWGIDEARGGLRIYDAIRRTDPDVFVHSGDNVYADGPLVAEVPLDDGTCGATW